MQPVALITGAGRGIGRATAIELSKSGYYLGLTSRTQSELDETAKLCGGGLTFASDVSSAQEAKRIVDQTMAKFGRIDTFVHCAGLALMLPIEQLSIEQWHATINTNLSAIFYFAQLLWPIWRTQGGGVMVNVSSAAARDPFAGLSAYGAAKAGVNLLGLSLAREGAPLNIRVHTVAPAATETAMFRSLLTPEQYPSSDTLAPADVAKVIVSCITGDMRYCSGEVIYMHKKV